MDVDRGILSSEPNGASAQMGNLADHQCHSICEPHRVPVAHDADKLTTPWQSVYGYFWRWTRSGLWERINNVLVQKVRKKTKRKPKPSAAIIDSQNVKTSEGGEQRGVDVHKQTPGRKRHLIVDTLGLGLLVLVHSASQQDGSGGYQTLQELFKRIKGSVHNRWCRLKLIWADGAYATCPSTFRLEIGNCSTF